jgi:predicted RNA-binding Zn ribbon-like protein
MAATSTAARFRQGAGRLCLDLIRTLRYRGSAAQVEELPDPAAVEAWIRQCGPVGLAAQTEPPTGSEVAEIQRVREAIRQLLMTARDPMGLAAVPREVRSVLNQAAARPVPAPQLDARGAVLWHAERSAPAVGAIAARDAIDLVTGGELDRVRECANPECGALFLDSSRPGTRRWCSMGTCGNRAKKASLQHRSTHVGH